MGRVGGGMGEVTRSKLFFKVTALTTCDLISKLRHIELNYKSNSMSCRSHEGVLTTPSFPQSVLRLFYCCSAESVSLG